MALNYAYNYAEIDLETGMCFGVRTTTLQIDDPALIPIPTDDDAYIFKFYHDGSWYEDAAFTIPWSLD